MSRKAFRLIPLLLIVALVVAVIPAANAQDKVTIVWFVGLGTGGQPEQIEMQESVVDAFNDSHDDIELEIVIADNNVAPDTLSTLIASGGDAPDIVGPVGTTGSNRFAGNWLDLEPVAEAVGYDLGQYPAAAVDYYRTDEGLIGLPFATFPSFLWYRPGLFEEAGLELPPAAYGDPYVLDGEEVAWTWDVVREIGMVLTVDANGFDATEDEFDADAIEQWGYNVQWSDPRGLPTHFGSGHIWDAEEGAVMPDHWREFYAWYYAGIWEDNFIPTAAEDGSDLLAAGNAFSSGNLAMATTHLWYTCCIADTEWLAAPMPSFGDSDPTVKLHGDTFRVLNGTDNPEAAFEVLSYLIGEASLDLLSVYGGMPAREADRGTFFDGLDEQYTQGVNWDVVKEGLNYPDNPSHEAWMPNFNQAEDVLQNFTTLLTGTPDLDVDEELDILLEDLQAVFDQ